MTYSKEELAKKFGDVFGASGNYNGSDADTERLMDNKELKNYFVDDLGRDEGDWTDGQKSSNDLDTVFDKLLSKESAAPQVKEAEPYQMSEELASAKAGVKAFEENILPNQGDIIMGLDKNEAGESTNRKKYLDAFSLNLKRNLEPVNADGSSRESKVRQEENEVAGIS